MIMMSRSFFDSVEWRIQVLTGLVRCVILIGFYGFCPARKVVRVEQPSKVKDLSFNIGDKYGFLWKKFSIWFRYFCIQEVGCLFVHFQSEKERKMETENIEFDVKPPFKWARSGEFCNFNQKRNLKNVLLFLWFDDPISLVFNFYTKQI